jgi:hypothetical protein
MEASTRIPNPAPNVDRSIVQGCSSVDGAPFSRVWQTLHQPFLLVVSQTAGQGPKRVAQTL